MCIRRNTFCITASLLFTFQTSLPLSRAISLKDSLFIISPCLVCQVFFSTFSKNFRPGSLPLSDTTLSVYHTYSPLSSAFFNFFKLFSHLSLRRCLSSDSLHSISSYSSFVNTFFVFLYFFISHPIYCRLYHILHTIFIYIQPLSQLLLTVPFIQRIFSGRKRTPSPTRDIIA